MKTIAYKTLGHCIYKYQIHLHSQIFVWAPIEHYSPSQVNIAESAVLCKGIESTFGLHFVCHCHFVAYLSRGFPISILSCSSCSFFFKLFPILQGLGSRLWVWGVLAELLGVSWTVVTLGGDSLAAQWEGSFKDTLLGIELSQCLVQNMNTHTSTHTAEVSKENESVWRGASKPGIMTFLPSFIISDTTSLSFRLLTSASFHKDQTHG